MHGWGSNSLVAYVKLLPFCGYISVCCFTDGVDLLIWETVVYLRVGYRSKYWPILKNFDFGIYFIEIFDNDWCVRCEEVLRGVFDCSISGFVIHDSFLCIYAGWCNFIWNLVQEFDDFFSYRMLSFVLIFL